MNSSFEIGLNQIQLDSNCSRTLIWIQSDSIGFNRIQSDSTITLQRVNSADVNNYGKVCVKYSRKTDKSILAKVREEKKEREGEEGEEINKLWNG